MKFRRQSTNNDEVNLTPLIDVVFLLLIFFMVSTSFTKETHLKVDLPQANGQPSSDLPEQIEILIAVDGCYAVNGRALVNTKIETLKTALEKTANGNVKIPLIITADAKSAHQYVVQAMDAAGQLGFVNLRMTTRMPDAEAEK
ncbi:MAG: biopolymer transporter ExbD [Cellvibrio sp.]|nr:biopolymer transporter ExbD [Cellvibrio sp.]